MRSNIYRIIDVNLNRATEGLRVVEELCRFVLEDPILTLKIKKVRGGLFRVIRISGDQWVGYQDIRVSATLLKERRVREDVGRETFTNSEGHRGNVADVFCANMKRAQEAVRCLEEFSKLLKPGYGRAFKNSRFKLYELEKQIAPKVSKAVKLDFNLYIIIDAKPTSLKRLHRAISKGVRIVQLRDKDVSKSQYFEAAKKIARITQKAGITFLLNDHWDLVKKVGADGVNLGQEDIKGLPVRKIRISLGEETIIGISASNLKEALKAEKLGADYIGFGPVFSTPIKPEVRPTGLNLLRSVVKRIKIPVVAIGGINGSNIDRVRKTGCQRVAVISAAAELLD